MYSKDGKLQLTLYDTASPHYLIMPLIGENSSVLDVGCNVGYIGDYLIRHKRCVCDGVDINNAFTKEAENRGYRRVYNFDLYYDNFHIKGKYDYILFLDILEHLPNPQKILQKIVRENLKVGGRVVICLPNIGRFEYRLSHLLGKFDYEQSRILSKDHLRFFTKRSAEELIKSCGLDVVRVIPTGLAQKVRVFPTLTAFQFIFLCQK